MVKILHIIRDEHDTKALDCIRRQSMNEHISIVSYGSTATETAVEMREPRTARIDEGTSKLENGQTIGYDELVNKIFEHDSIVIW